MAATTKPLPIVLAMLLAASSAGQNSLDRTSFIETLNLSSSQEEQFDSIENQHIDLIRPLLVELLNKNALVAKALRDGTLDSPETQILEDERRSLRDRIETANADFRRNFRSILTSQQLSDFNQIEYVAAHTAALTFSMDSHLVEYPEGHPREGQTIGRSLWALARDIGSLPIPDPPPPPPPPAEATHYETITDWRVEPGRVQLLFFNAGGCIVMSNTSLNGVTYTIHTSKWQTRTSDSGPWTDIDGTEEEGRICSYRPNSAGQYRPVAEISIDGERGWYTSSNTLTYP